MQFQHCPEVLGLFTRYSHCLGLFQFNLTSCCACASKIKIINHIQSIGQNSPNLHPALTNNQYQFTLAADKVQPPFSRSLTLLVRRPLKIESLTSPSGWASSIAFALLVLYFWFGLIMRSYKSWCKHDITKVTNTHICHISINIMYRYKVIK